MPEQVFFGALCYDPNPDGTLREIHNVMIFKVPAKSANGLRFFHFAKP